MTETSDKGHNSTATEEMPIGMIPVITSRIQPADIDSSRTIMGGFGSNERETIARAIIMFYQEKGNWHCDITVEDIKTRLFKLDETDLAHPLYNLENKCGFDGFACPNVGDGRLLQKVAKNTYAVTDLFIEICYKHSPKT